MFEADGPRGQNYQFQTGAPLLDPYALALVPLEALGSASGRRYRGVIVEDSFDWEGDEPPKHPWTSTIIYETHVRGLTMHPSSAARHSGQYLGVLEKIPYLKSLGITTLELMPVQAFEPGLRVSTASPELRQYWGYDPIALFAPMPAYGSDRLQSSTSEFKTMVRDLHRSGLEVVVDVVFNHTAEQGGMSVFSLRGLANEIYYMLDGSGKDLDFTGCGNTLNCNHPVVREMIIDCLRHWVMHMHVDGFRFDLASVLGRDQSGGLMANPPLLEEIAEDPLLRGVKLIAEAWDAAGASQVRMFSGAPWAEWNGNYRDDIRRFWRGDPGMSGRFATRLCGSADLHQPHAAGAPIKSINFITCHDGFTLNDLVSCSEKHNQANGQENRDGSDANYSDNNGIEGPSADTAVEELRARQIRNMLLSLFVSKGVPMLLGGDEFRRTQHGNNNAYCQDNETSWYDWRLAEVNKDLLRFVRRLVEFRRLNPLLGSERFYTDEDVEWFGPAGRAVAWDGPHNRVGCLIRQDGRALILLFNAALETCQFVLQHGPTGMWRVAFDTRRAAPEDAPEPDDAAMLTGGAQIELPPRSSMALQAC